MDRAEVYYREDVQGFWGLTQGELLPPTIFNVVVDAMLRHWISLVVGVSGGKNGWEREVIHHTVFFYAYEGLVTSTK